MKPNSIQTLSSSKSLFVKLYDRVPHHSFPFVWVVPRLAPCQGTMSAACTKAMVVRKELAEARNISTLVDHPQLSLPLLSFITSLPFFPLSFLFSLIHSLIDLLLSIPSFHLSNLIHNQQKKFNILIIQTIWKKKSYSFNVKGFS